MALRSVLSVRSTILICAFFDAPVPDFPETELKFGHMLFCLSLDLETLNKMAIYLKKAGSNVNAINVPYFMRHLLPAWDLHSENLNLDEGFKVVRGDPLNFVIGKRSSSPGTLLARKPGQRHCLYNVFAKRSHLILDVYAPNVRHRKNMCDKFYGIRTINSISLKSEFSLINYVNNQTDKSCFAVSTASSWQKTISAKAQYWTCFSGLGREEPTKGGILLCVHNYQLWVSLDHLKVKEPDC